MNNKRKPSVLESLNDFFFSVFVIFNIIPNSKCEIFIEKEWKSSFNVVIELMAQGGEYGNAQDAQNRLQTMYKLDEIFL